MSALQPIRPFTINDVDNQHKFEKFFWSGVNAYVTVVKDVAKADTFCNALTRVIRAVICAIQIPFFCAGAGLFALYGYANRSTKLQAALQTNQPLTSFTYSNFLNLHPGIRYEPLDLPAFCRYIRHNNTLQSIRIYDEQLPPDALKSICEALHGNASLQKLEILGSRQSLSAIEAVGSLLANNTTLQMLKLNSCEIEASGFDRIMEGLHGNTTLKILNLSRNRILHFNLDRSLPGLKHLDITNNHRVDFEDLEEIVRFTGRNGVENLLISFDFTGLKPPSNLNATFAQNKVLKTLTLSGDRLRRTSDLNYPLNRESAGILFQALSNSESLKMLVLRDFAIDGSALDVVTENLTTHPTLEAFGIANDRLCRNSIKQIIQAVSLNPRITELKLEKCLPKGFYKDSEILGLIENNKTITHLDLSQNWRVHQNTDGLTRIIQNNTTLTYLNLSGCDLTTEELQEIVRALESNTTLTALRLDENTDPAIAAQITRILQRNYNS